MNSLMKGGFGLLNFVMFRTFAFKVRHFLFDDPWINPISSWRIEMTGNFIEHAVVEDRKKLCLGSLHSGDRSRDYLQSADERNPVRIKIPFGSRFGHQSPHGHMGNQQAINFLQASKRSLAAKRGGLIDHVRFNFIKSDFYFPTLMVKHDQFLGRIKLMIQKRSDQAVLFTKSWRKRIGDRVFDDAYEDSSILFTPGVGTRIEFRKERAIRKILNWAKDHVAFEPPQQMGAALPGFIPKRITDKSPVPQEKHAFLQRSHHPNRCRLLRGFVTTDTSVNCQPSPNFDQDNDCGHRPSCLAPSCARTAKESFILRSVRNIQIRSINCHQSQSFIESPCLIGRCNRMGQRTKKFYHRFNSKPLPCLSQSAFDRKTCPQQICPLNSQTFDENIQHLRHRLLGEKCHRDYQKHNDPGRKHPLALLNSPRRVENVLHKLGIHHLRERFKKILSANGKLNFRNPFLVPSLFMIYQPPWLNKGFGLPIPLSAKEAFYFCLN